MSEQADRLAGCMLPLRRPPCEATCAGAQSRWRAAMTARPVAHSPGAWLVPTFIESGTRGAGALHASNAHCEPRAVAQAAGGAIVAALA